MKNLKRALSFALAPVMVIGMMVVGAGAAFTDEAKITNTEAAEVMAALGIITGKPDGDALKFDPTATLTRAEAAKIITYMLLGEEKAEKLGTSGVNFTDVPANHWAAAYIGYCANMGIISGYNGEFNPTGELTGLAFGKMLLVALGYDAAVEGYTGTADWGVNVAIDMIEAGIDLGDDVEVDAALSRDNAAQMAFNTLTATLVKYDTKGTSINIGGVEITTGAATAEAVTYLEAEGYDYTTGNDDAAEGATVQFCEKYFKNLAKTTTAAGKYGRPTYTWTFEDEADKTVTVEAEAKLTYTAKVTGGKLYTDLGKPATAPTITVYVDGKLTTTNLPPIITSGNTAQITDTAGTPNNLTGAGVLTEVYKTATNTYTVCIINTYVGTIGAWVKADINDDGEVVAKEYVEVTANATKYPGTLATSGKFVTTAFEKADATDATVVIYTVSYDGTSDYTVKSVAAAKKVENVAVSSYSSTKVNEYTKAAKADDVDSFTMTGGATYNLYLDVYGNVIFADDYTAAGSNDYVMITAMSGTEQGDATVAKVYYNVKYVDMNGTLTIVKVADKSALDYTTIYTVTEDEDNAGFHKFVEVDDIDRAYLANDKLNKTQPVVASGFVADANTVFVLKTKASPVTYKVVTGIANVPAYTVAATTVYAYGVDKAGDGYADVIFMDLSADTSVPADTTDGEIIYLLEQTADAYDADLKKEYDVYAAIVNGVKTTVKVKNGQDMSAKVNKLVKITARDADGFITNANTAVVSGTGYAAIDFEISAEIKYSAPALTIVGGNTYYLAEDCVVYMINSTDALTVGTAADFVCTRAAGKLTLVCKSTTDKTIKAIYFDGTITE